MRRHAIHCMCLALAGLMGASAGVFADASQPVAPGRVVGTVHIRYQPGEGTLNKMNESMRSRKWRFNVGLASDGGLGYRIRERFTVAEGAPGPVVLNMPADVYRLAEAENAASLGMEKMIVSLDAPFDVLPGQTTYFGRVQLEIVVGKWGRPAARWNVVDCRAEDLVLIRTQLPDLAADAVQTQLLRMPAMPVDAPTTFHGCEASEPGATAKPVPIGP